MFDTFPRHLFEICHPSVHQIVIFSFLFGLVRAISWLDMIFDVFLFFAKPPFSLFDIFYIYCCFVLFIIYISLLIRFFFIFFCFCSFYFFYTFSLWICRFMIGLKLFVHENLRGTRPRGGRMLELGKKHNLSVTKPIPTRGAFFLYGDCLVVCLIRFRRIVGQGDGTKGSVIPFELGRWRDVYVVV